MRELKVIKRNNCTDETGQTSGMTRLAGVARETSGAQHLWMGFVTMKEGAESGAHHHGRCESAIYIISGQIRFLWGGRLEHVSDASAGDFIFVPPHLIHKEINPSESEPVDMIVARDSAEAIVVNVDRPDTKPRKNKS